MAAGYQGPPSLGAGNLPSLQTYPQMQVLGPLLPSVLELGSNPHQVPLP